MAIIKQDYGALGGGENIVVYDDGHYEDYTLGNAFDNNDSTFWISKGDSPRYGGMVTIDFIEPRSLSKITLRTGSYGGTDVTMTINIYGGNNPSGQNKTLITTTTAKYSDGKKNISVSGSYRCYFIIPIGNSSAFGSFSHLSFQ